MPTLDEWQNALLMLKEIRIISDNTLIQDVNSKPNSKSYFGPRKLAVIAPEVHPHRVATIRPVEILGAMGLITTPRIDNLVDLCSTWARIRYIWAFHPEPISWYGTSKQLRLSNEALDIDFHQKTLLSDEIGVGMAALVMDKYFNGYNPVDIDVALKQSSIPGMSKIGEASPDYIFQNKLNNSYMVVECKGTRSGYNTVLNQLKRGTEQVRSLQFTSTTVPSYVIATEMSSSRTNVYVIDPPDEQSGKRNSVIIRDEAAFTRGIQESQAANIYRYIGAFGRAYKLQHHFEPRRGAIIQDPPNEQYVEDLQQTYVGIRQDLRVPGEFGNVSIFQGVPQQVYLNLNQSNYEAADRLIAVSYERARQVSIRAKEELSPRPAIYTFARTTETLSVRLYRRDGTLLQIDISR